MAGLGLLPFHCRAGRGVYVCSTVGIGDCAGSHYKSPQLTTLKRARGKTTPDFDSRKCVFFILCSCLLVESQFKTRLGGLCVIAAVNMQSQCERDAGMAYIGASFPRIMVG